jgi:hypothetical protein
MIWTITQHPSGRMVYHTCVSVWKPLLFAHVHCTGHHVSACRRGEYEVRSENELWREVLVLTAVSFSVSLP